MRHTQLLPRQILYYFNQIAIINYEANGGWRTFDHASVVKGVEQAENLICEEVFSAFGAVYPMAKELCEYVLPRFQPIMKYGDLHRIWNNCNTDGMGDKRTFPEFLKMLFDMGVMGEVIVGQNVMRDRPYIEGRFQCNSEGRIVVSEAANLCVHPIFSKFFNVRREAGEKRAVYPYGCELEQLPWPTDQLLGHVAAL